MGFVERRIAVIGDFPGRDCKCGTFEVNILIVEKDVGFKGF
jgi:hypothetical protein